MRHFLLSFTVSAGTTLWLIHSAKHLKGPRDADFCKPQKIHTHEVLRIGGLGIVVGLLAAAAWFPWTLGPEAAGLAWGLLACSIPAFAAGFYQDWRDDLTPRWRLLATALSATLTFFLLDVAIRETAIPGLDWVAGFAAGSLFLTVLAVTGIANAINIIDGLNGLASMCVMIMLAAVAYVAFSVGDTVVATLALAGVGAVLGFFIWNFPTGLIFLGDGGAYFLGFYLAEVAILLLVRNPGVSPLFPLVVCLYPIVETLFSIYRRFWLRSSLPSLPDGIHLHSLLYRRLMRWAVGSRTAKAMNRRNSMTSTYLWLLCSTSVVPAVLFWDRSAPLAVALLLFVVGYVVLYWRIVRFKSPRWLRPGRMARTVVKRDNPVT